MMNKILENKTLELSNVLSYRAKMNPQEISVAMKNIEQFIKESDANKVGGIATVTYAVEIINAQQTMDIEILVSLDKEISMQEYYIFKPIVKVSNALYIRHKGNPVLIQNTINKLNEHIINNNLQVITGTYNITAKVPTSQVDTEQIIVDIYVGVNPDIT